MGTPAASALETIPENARAALPAIFPPRAAGGEMRGTTQVLDPNLIGCEKIVALFLDREMDAEFGVNQIADHQRPGGGGSLERLHGSIAKIGVRKKNVEQNVGIDGGDHLPRMSSMKSSTEGYPRSPRLPPQWPFHLSRSSLFGALVKMIEPCSTWNSTSEFGPSPNWSRMSFGIVTWPRSPTLILLSMDRYSYLIKPPDGPSVQPYPALLPDAEDPKSRL